jgi:hypothetical protein
MRSPDPPNLKQSPLVEVTVSDRFLRFVKPARVVERLFPLDGSADGSLREAWRSGIERSNLLSN